MNLDFLRIESFRRGIVFSSIFNLLSKSFVFFQNMAIAHFFGIQSKTDVLFFCLGLITLGSVFINNLDTSVLIPESMTIKEERGGKASNLFLNQFIFVYLIIGVAVSLICLIAPINAFNLISDFDEEVLRKNEAILTLSGLVFTLMVVTNILVNILTSNKYFTIPMIIGVINGFIVLTFTFFLHHEFDVKSIMLGQLIAYLFNIILLVGLMKKYLEWNFFIVRFTASKNVLKNIIYAQSGALVSLLASYIPIYMITSLNSGILTALTFGQRTSEIPIQLIVTQISVVAGIKLNELFSRKDYENINRIFTTTSRFMIFITIPISSLVFIYSSNIISFLFERGLFTSIAVEYAANFLKLFSLALPLLAVNSIVARLLMAAKKIRQGFIYQVLLNSLLILSIVVGIRSYEAIGYVYAIVFVQLINFFLIFFLLKISIPNVDYGKFILYFLKIVFVNILITFVISYLNAYFNIDSIFSFIIGACLYLLILLLLNYFFELNSESTMMIKKGILQIKSYL